METDIKAALAADLALSKNTKMSKTMKIQTAVIALVNLLLGVAIGLYVASNFIGNFIPELSK
jgi:uncharacterized membrane protein